MRLEKKSRYSAPAITVVAAQELQAILTYRKALVDFDRVQQTGTGGNITIFSR